MKQLSCLLVVFFILSCNLKDKNTKEPPLPATVDSLFQSVFIDTLSRNTQVDAIQQLEVYFERRENDSTKRRNYFKIANRYYYLNDFENYYQYATKAFELGVMAKDTLTIARGHYYFGDHYSEFKNIDSAFYHYNRAQFFYEFTDDRETLGTVLLKKSGLYKSIRDFVNSEKFIVEAMEIAEEEDDPLLNYGVYNYMGNLLMDLKEYAEARRYYQSALKETKRFEEVSHYKLRLENQLNLNIGISFLKQENFIEAEQFFYKALNQEEIFYLYPSNYANLLQNLAYTKHRLGEKNVMPLFKRALKIQDSMGYGYAKAATQNQIAHYYLERNQPDSSFYFANAAYQQAKQAKVLENELEAIHLLAKTDPQNSSQWYETYINLQDSITNYERRQQEKFALIAFDTENLKLQKLRAENRAGRLIYQLWFIAGISMLLTSFGFLVFKYRSKRLKNRELLLKQEELESKEKIYTAMLEEQFKIEEGKHLEKKRISRELHDGVLGKLSGIRLNLFVLNKKKDQETIEKCLPYIKDLQYVEKEIRAISHNLSEDLFSDQVNFTKMISNLYENIASHTNIKFHIHIDELIDWKTISTTIKIEVYRIIQEGLHNIEKHAKASNVTVKMFQNETHLIIELVDDGVGMDIKAWHKGIGLKNMKERAAKIKASLHIDSKKNNGTTLSLLLPKKVVLGMA